MVYAIEKMVTAPEDTMFESSSEDIPRSEEIFISQAAVKCKNARYPIRIPGETVKKVVIPSQCAHWRGNLPDDRNIFDSENIGFPKIWGDRHTSLRAGSR